MAEAPTRCRHAPANGERSSAGTVVRERLVLSARGQQWVWCPKCGALGMLMPGLAIYWEVPGTPEARRRFPLGPPGVRAARPVRPPRPPDRKDP